MSFLETFLLLGHVTVIHFPIIGIVMGFVAGATALGLGITQDILRNKKGLSKQKIDLFYRYMERFEFLSFCLLIMGQVGLIVAALTGISAAGDMDTAVNHDMLNLKIRLSVFLFFILFTPIVQKIYFGWRLKTHIFTCKSRVIPLLYLGPILVAAFLAIIIASIGGQMSYGFNILDVIGLKGIVPS